MGNTASSEVKVVDNTMIINQSQIDMLNQTLNESIANVIVNTAQTCSQGGSSSQIIEVGDIYAGGDLEIEFGQDQQVTLNFSCTQKNEVHASMSQQLFSDIYNNLKKSNTTKTMTDLDAAAKNALTSGTFAWGPSSKSSAVTETNYQQVDIKNYNLQNVIQNVVSNNFTKNDVSTCVNTIIGSQVIKTDNIYGDGNVTIKANQKQEIAALAECQQFSSTSVDMTSILSTALGVEIIDDTDTERESSGSGSSDNKSEYTGLFQDLGEMFNDVLTGLGDVLGSLLIPSLIILGIICIVIIISSFVLLFAGTSGSNSAQGYDTSVDYNADFGDLPPVSDYKLDFGEGLDTTAYNDIELPETGFGDGMNDFANDFTKKLANFTGGFRFF